MEDFDAVFAAALRECLGEHAKVKDFAEKFGISAPYLSQLLNGRRVGSENLRRKIAGRLGYPGRKYEEFLDVGRSFFNHSTPDRKVDLPEGSPALPKWLDKLLPDMLFLDRPGQRKVMTLVKELAKNLKKAKRKTKATA
ncbi:MAG: helix-turn-helix domain-containing protein [Deltaproteobacteria bacterium]|jgi:transcriptional regulator with XRE-family HTH domain|nr:helix-turn-helix domain-containing protein [Deltaproteobacteria bacterium]